MECNMGDNDRRARLAVGVLLLVLGVVYQSWWGLFGLIMLITSAIGFCPAYVPFRISTVKKGAQQVPIKKSAHLKDAKKKGK